MLDNNSYDRQTQKSHNDINNEVILSRDNTMNRSSKGMDYLRVNKKDKIKIKIKQSI